jgi:hypothetical protein
MRPAYRLRRAVLATATTTTQVLVHRRALKLVIGARKV